MSDQDTSGLLARFSDELADAVAAAGRRTVAVLARRRLPGSGVLWDAQGVIVTADHVLERDDDLQVLLADGRELPATLVGRDPSTDLAVLRVAADGLPAVPPPEEVEVRVGHYVLAVGRLDAGPPSASGGIVSAIGGPWRGRRGALIEGYLRTDLVLYPGFSGGPLVDARGRIIGINTSLLARGHGLALPLATVRRVTTTLLAKGRVQRGYLGIGTQPVALPAPLAARVGGQTRGLLVLSVEPASPAERAGLLLGDILVAFAGHPLRDTDDLLALLGPERIGTSQPLTIVRGGEPRTLTVTVGER
ncbi:MAG TPA: trypsin-like peptidase domain-containing protein [Chloroflexota bacterium]|nr:trypsin-like peptidase domain-containing protein [Chloroflexota bacterium]